MEFIITETNLDFSTFWLLVSVVVFWVLGFKTITTKGKIGNFIARFFEKEIDRKEYAKAEGNKKYDEEIIARLPKDYKEQRYDDAECLEIIKKYMTEKKLHTEYPIKELLYKLMVGTDNQYYFFKSVRRFSDKIVNPIVGCPTCMPSLHGLIVYTLVGYYFAWFWNPVEWLLVAIVSTFFTEQLWKLRNVLDKKVNN